MARLLRGAFALFLVAGISLANSNEYLIRFKNNDQATLRDFVARNGGSLELVSEEGVLYKWTSEHKLERSDDKAIEYIQPNRMMHIFQSPSLIENREALLKAILQNREVPKGPAFPDNPPIENPPTQATGPDPLLPQAWGIPFIGADVAWTKTNQGKDIVVAVTDTGVDYNHPDLIANMWRNKGEIPDNNIDDDKNGYVDDVVGWDFASNDNRPYDLSMSFFFRHSLERRQPWPRHACIRCHRSRVE